MARIRTVKPEFWVDEKVVELDPWERLLFIGLWNFADDQGYVDLSVKRIKMQIFPGDTYDVSVGLARLYRANLVACYESPKGHVLHIVNWAKHQRVSNPAKERFKPGELRKLNSLPESSVGLARSLESYPAEGKGKEGKGKEGSPSVATLARETPTADVITTVTVPRATLPVDKPRDRDVIDRAALERRITAAANDRAAQIHITSQIVTIWTDATEAEAERVAHAIRLDRQPTNLAALALAIADAGELPDWVRRLRTEQPYRHQHTGAALREIATHTRADPPAAALAEARAKAAAAAARHHAGERKPAATPDQPAEPTDPDTLEQP